MKRIRKVNLNLLLVLCVVCISMLYPMTSRAEGNVPGGFGNIVKFNETGINKLGNVKKSVRTAEIHAKDDVEIVGRLEDFGVSTISIQLFYVKDGKYGVLDSNYCTDYVTVRLNYDSDNNILNSESGSFYNSFFIGNYSDSVQYITSYSGFKVFDSLDSVKAYAQNGSLDGMIKDELDKMWYLENVGYKVDADDSPTSEAGEDATYITFTWDTDNLQDGDLLEIKTHNYLKKIGGDQISGFHDYITHWNNVSAYTGKYRFSQYDATKAWFSTLDNKPLIFKSYDTDIYYLRPYRNGVYGGWVKITIGRSPVIKGSPYVEDIEYGDFDEDDEWMTDEELTEKNGGHHGVDQNGNITYPDIDNPFEGTNVTGIFKWFFDFMKEIPSFLGDLPALVGSIIGFLPPQIIGFIALGLVVAIILRIVGR